MKILMTVLKVPVRVDIVRAGSVRADTVRADTSACT